MWRPRRYGGWGTRGFCTEAGRGDLHRRSSIRPGRRCKGLRIGHRGVEIVFCFELKTAQLGDRGFHRVHGRPADVLRHRAQPRRQGLDHVNHGFDRGNDILNRATDAFRCDGCRAAQEGIAAIAIRGRSQENCNGGRRPSDDTFPQE